MSETSILFNGPMIRAILAGQKTQTRRLIKPQPKLPNPVGPPATWNRPGTWTWSNLTQHEAFELCMCGEFQDIRCPYGVQGDILRVRETCRAEELESGLDGVRYRADNAFLPIENSLEASDRWADLYYYDHKRRGMGGWVPSIHAPLWTSRITLKNTGVWVHRIQDISEKDAHAEGFPIDCKGNHYDPPLPEVDQWQGYGKASFALSWSKTYDVPFAWADNPWVWVVEFEVVQIRKATS